MFKISEIRYKFFETKKKEDNLWSELPYICKIVSTGDLQYVQCISLLVRGESRDSHLYQQGPNGGP